MRIAMTPSWQDYKKDGLHKSPSDLFSAMKDLEQRVYKTFHDAQIVDRSRVAVMQDGNEVELTDGEEIEGAQGYAGYLHIAD